MIIVDIIVTIRELTTTGNENGASQGQIELFDSRKDEWDSWSRRFDHAVVINKSVYMRQETTLIIRSVLLFVTFIGFETFNFTLYPLHPEEARGMHLCGIEGQAKRTVWNKETSFGRTLSFLRLQAARETIIVCNIWQNFVTGAFSVDVPVVRGMPG